MTILIKLHYEGNKYRVHQKTPINEKLVTSLTGFFGAPGKWGDENQLQ